MDLLFAESSIKGWGTEQHFAALSIAMLRRSHQVRCLIAEGSPLEPVLREAAVPVIVRPRRSMKNIFSRLGRLREVMAQRRPDWLITNDPRFYWPVVLAGKMTGSRSALFRHWERFSKSFLSRNLLPRLPDRFVVVSQAQRNNFRREGIDVSGMQILYNPVDMDRFCPSPEARARMRAELGVPEDRLLVGYVGRIVGFKGVHDLFAASEAVLSASPNVSMLWVGDGPDLAPLRASVEQSAHRERHLFRTWTPDMPAVYNAVDVIAVPSVYPDPCPRVPVEAQACGTPVICSEAGGLPETLFPGVSGTLVKVGDVAQLSAAILELTGDAGRRKAMSLAGRRFVRANFSFEHIASHFEAMLEDKRSSQQIGYPGPGAAVPLLAGSPQA